MKVVSRTLEVEDAKRDGCATFERLLDELGDLEDGGLTITLLTEIKALEPIERPEVKVDYSRATKDFSAVYVCMCGWETNSVANLVNHLARHGARRLTVVPEGWRPKE